MFRREGSRLGGSGAALDAEVESAIRGRVKEVFEGVLPGADEVLNLLDMLTWGSRVSCLLETRVTELIFCA